MGVVALVAAAATAADVVGTAALADAATAGAVDMSMDLPAAAGSLGDVAAADAGTTAASADAVDSAAQTATTNPVQSITQSIQNSVNSLNSTLNNMVPGGSQTLKTAYQIAQGVNPTTAIMNNLKSQALNGISSDVTSSTGSSDLGKFASGAINSAINGGNPITGGLTSDLSSNINSVFNGALADVTGISGLPSLNVSSTLLNPTASSSGSTRQGSTNSYAAPALATATQLPTLSLDKLGLQSIAATPSTLATRSPTAMTTASNSAPLSQLYSSLNPNQATMKDGGVAHFATGSTTSGTSGFDSLSGIKSTLSVPSLTGLDSYTQMDTSIDPSEDLVYNNRLVTPGEETLLSSNPVLFSKDGGSTDDESIDQDMEQPGEPQQQYSQLMSLIIPELMQMLQARSAPAQSPQGYADGDLVLSPDSSSKLQDAFKAMKENATPSFHIYQPTTLTSQNRAAAPRIGALTQAAESQHMGTPLTQMDQGPLSGVAHHGMVSTHPFAGAYYAKGGLHKYAEAAPEGHHPEFITGITGYYAGGRGTGQSDEIPAMLHDGDYVIDADAVAALGDGSSKAGNHALMEFMHNVPHHKHNDGKPVPAQIADGEVVLPESFVTALGHGDNRRGAKMLDKMREELRAHKRSAPDTKIPPKAKSPLEYLKMAKG